MKTCYIIGLNSTYEFIPAISETETAEEAIARYIKEAEEFGWALNQDEIDSIGELPEADFQRVCNEITGTTSIVFNNVQYYEKNLRDWDLDEDEIRNGYTAVRYTA